MRLVSGGAGVQAAAAVLALSGFFKTFSRLTHVTSKADSGIARAKSNKQQQRGDKQFHNSGKENVSICVSSSIVNFA